MSIISGFENVVRENEPLAPHLRLRLGGPAEFFAEPTSLDELGQLVRRFVGENMPIRLLGGGSNILVRDEGVAGLVIHPSAPAFTRLESATAGLRAGAGVKLSHFISLAVREGLSGPEKLVGIPGTIGGALYGNAGTHSGDIGSLVRSATVMNRRGELVQHARPEMTFAYRKSSLDELAIVEAEFELDQGDSGELTRRMQKLWIVKRAGEPGLDEDAAYVFKDHAGEPAGRLIERAGLRGARIGAVEVSSRDANFFVAGPGAKSSDVLRLIDLVRTQVADRLGAQLQLSLEIW
jgi:UDP-N-acetylmuramate dehydrogenase